MNDSDRWYHVFFRYTLTGFFKWLWLRVTGRQVVVAGECLQCGRCCSRLNLTWKDHWIRKEKDFEEMLAEYPEYERFEHIGNTPAGIMIFSCDRLTDDGLCGDNDNPDRPAFCGSYPDHDLCFMGGELLDHCGYRFETAPSFRKMLKKELEIEPGDERPFKEDTS